MADNPYLTKVDEATNEDPWGPTGSQMDDLALIYGEGQPEILKELLLRLEGRASSWRRCFKSLLVVDHLLRNVTASYIDDIRVYFSATIREISTTFFYKDERGVDHGISVRERAKKILELMNDREYLDGERAKTKATRAKVAGVADSSMSGFGSSSSHSSVAYPSSYAPRSSPAAEPHARSPSSAANYDPYSNKHSAGGGAGTHKSQQQSDFELAVRLQAEEDARAGHAGASAERLHRLEQQHHASHPTTHTPPAPTTSGATLLRGRLVEPAPTLTPVATPPVVAAPAQPVVRQPPPPVHDVLGDIFAAPKPAPSAQQQQAVAPDAFDFFDNPAPSRPGGAAHTPQGPLGTAAPPDPVFDTFLASRGGAPAPQRPPAVSTQQRSQQDPFSFFA